VLVELNTLLSSRQDFGLEVWEAISEIHHWECGFILSTNLRHVSSRCTLSAY